MESLSIRRVSLSELVPDPANARAHNERNLDAIRASLARFGQAEPLVVQRSTRRVIGGHGRLAAAMPEALCAGIERICKAHKLQLAGIEPGYTFALGKYARRIRDGAIAIAELEETAGTAAIAHIGFRRGGGWTGFVALPVPGALDDLWRDALALCAVEAPERRYVIGPGAADRWIADRAQVEWLAAPWDASS